MITKERQEYMKRWRKEHLNYNKEYLKRWSRTKKGRESMKRDTQRKRERFIEIKKQYSCDICGEGDLCCLDFHHIDPTMKESLVARAASSWGFERLKKEIKKCRVLCANCHRKLHFYGREE